MRLVIKKFFARFREPFTKTLILAVVAAFAFWGLVLLDTFQDPLSPLGRDVMRYVADGEARGLSSATRSIGVRPTVSLSTTSAVPRPPTVAVRLGAYLVQNGTALHGVYSVLRVTLLGAFTLCVVEVVLTWLQWAGFPSVTLREITDSLTKKNAPERGAESGVASATSGSLVTAFGLPKLLTTTIVSGVLGTVVLAPEVVSGARDAMTSRSSSNETTATTERVLSRLDSQLAMIETIRTDVQKTNSDLTTKIETVRDRTERVKESVRETVVKEMDNGRVGELHGAVVKLAADEAHRSQAIAGQLSEIGYTLRAGESKIDHVAASVGAVRATVGTISTGVDDMLGALKSTSEKVDHVGRWTTAVNEHLGTMDARGQQLLRYQQYAEQTSWWRYYLSCERARRQSVLSAGMAGQPTIPDGPCPPVVESR